MSGGFYIVGVIAVAAAATFLTRVLPFLMFDKKTKPSAFLDYLHKNMPLMIMIALVFYAVRDTKWAEYPYGFSEIICIGVAFGLHIAFKNALLSIIAATVTYMFLVQAVFV